MESIDKERHGMDKAHGCFVNFSVIIFSPKASLVLKLLPSFLFNLYGRHNDPHSFTLSDKWTLSPPVTAAQNPLRTFAINHCRQVSPNSRQFDDIWLFFVFHRLRCLS